LPFGLRKFETVSNTAIPLQMPKKGEVNVRNHGWSYSSLPTKAKKIKKLAQQ